MSSAIDSPTIDRPVTDFRGRENAEIKGRRYLTEGRLQLQLVTREEIRALCRGNGAQWHLGCSSGNWWCDCPARGRCSHLVALMLVTCLPVETWVSSTQHPRQRAHGGERRGET